MQIQLETQPYASIQADALVTYVFDQDNKLDGVLADIDGAMNGRLAALAASGEITGKALETRPGPFSRRPRRQAPAARRGREARKILRLAICAKLPAPRCAI